MAKMVNFMLCVSHHKFVKKILVAVEASVKKVRQGVLRERWEWDPWRVGSQGRTQPCEDLGRQHSPQRDTNGWRVGWRGGTGPQEASYFL